MRRMMPEVKNLVTSKKPLVVVPVVLALVLAGLFLPVEVSIEPYGVLSLESKITITIGYEAAYASPDWVSPIGHNDPGNEWSNEINAYDGDTETTYAADSIAAQSWSNYLELTIEAINCDKVRYCFGRDVVHISQCEIDVYYSGGWVNIFPAGLPTFNAWTEVSLGSTQSVTNARMKFYNKHSSKPSEARVYEFAFNELPPLSNIPTSKDFGNVTTSTDYWAYGGTTAPGFPLDNSECFFEVTNNSSQAVNIVIRATDFSGGVGWTLAGTPAGDTVTLRAGKSGDALETDMVTLTTSDQAFITALGARLPKKWELKMETPTLFGDGVQKQSTITLTATFSS